MHRIIQKNTNVQIIFYQRYRQRKKKFFSQSEIHNILSKRIIDYFFFRKGT